MKFWTKTPIAKLEDWRIASLPDKLWRRYFEMYILAARFDKGGYLPDSSQLAWILRQPMESLKVELNDLVDHGLVQINSDSVYLIGWAEEQKALEPAERKRQERMRKNQAAGGGLSQESQKSEVTEQSQTVTSEVTELSRHTTQSQSKSKSKSQSKSQNQIKDSSNSVVVVNDENFQNLADAYQEITCNDLTDDDNNIIEKMCELEISADDLYTAAEELSSKGYIFPRAESLLEPAKICRARRLSAARPKEQSDWAKRNLEGPYGSFISH